jgi:hypothetical protein
VPIREPSVSDCRLPQSFVHCPRRNMIETAAAAHGCDDADTSSSVGRSVGRPTHRAPTWTTDKLDRQAAVALAGGGPAFRNFSDTDTPHACKTGLPTAGVPPLVVADQNESMYVQWKMEPVLTATSPPMASCSVPPQLRNDPVRSLRASSKAAARHTFFDPVLQREGRSTGGTAARRGG